MLPARVALGVSVLLLTAVSLTACSGNASDAAGPVVTVTAVSTVPASAASTSATPATSAAATPTTSATATPTTSATATPTTSATAIPTATPTGAATTRTSPPVPTSCAQSALALLTPAQRVGQLMMVGIPADGLGTSSSQGIPTLPVGGVFLSGKSTSSSDDVKAGIDAIQQSVAGTSGVKAQIAVDQEGGYVQSLRGDDFPSIPTAVEQGQLSQSDLRDETLDWSTRLVQAGITLDLAPVADVVPAGTADQNPPIGGQDRQYGSTPDSVGESVTTVVKAMLGAKLGTTAKHFPGLGRVTENTDTSTFVVDDRTSAEDPALQPFRDAVSAGTSAVMISNATYPQLDPDRPAAFSSKIITGLLRNQLHFGGLVISDDLGIAAAVSATPAGQRAVDFVTAGGDMVLTVRSFDLAPMTAALTAAYGQSASFRARVADADRHVLESKQKLGLLACDGD